MLKLNLRNNLLLTLLLVSSLVFAAPQDPIEMMKSITSNVLQALKQNSAKSKVNQTKIYDVVDKYILPYVDFNEMSTWVAGRAAWNKASPAAREEFVSAFKVLVVRTYATALNSYSNETVDFVTQKVDTSKNRIQITSWIKRQNKDNIRVDYRLIKHGDSWLVYDVIIEGVSIVQGFQAQFSEKIKQRGLDPVIAEIQQHNKQSEAKT